MLSLNAQTTSPLPIMPQGDRVSPLPRKDVFGTFPKQKQSSNHVSRKKHTISEISPEQKGVQGISSMTSPSSIFEDCLKRLMTRSFVNPYWPGLKSLILVVLEAGPVGPLRDDIEHIILQVSLRAMPAYLQKRGHGSCNSGDIANLQPWQIGDVFATPRFPQITDHNVQDGSPSC